MKDYVAFEGELSCAISAKGSRLYLTTSIDGLRVSRVEVTHTLVAMLRDVADAFLAENS